MKPYRTIMILMLCSILFCPALQADVRQRLLTTINISGTVQDIAVSADGNHIVVLDQKGDVVIYNRQGKQLHQFSVGKDIDKLRIGNDADELFLYDKSRSVVEVVDLTFVFDINITGAPFKGASNAKVTIVVFSDFQCPYCARVAEYLQRVVQQYPDKVKLVFKHYPLTRHKFAMAAAKATIAAQAQGKFWEFHDLLFQNYKQINEEKIQEISKTLALDEAAFQEQRVAPATIRKIVADKQEGQAIQVTGTPAVFVNGAKVERNSYSHILAAVKAALAKP